MANREQDPGNGNSRDDQQQGTSEMNDAIRTGTDALGGLIYHFRPDQAMVFPAIPRKEYIDLSLKLGAESTRYLELTLQALQIQALAQAMHGNLPGGNPHEKSPVRIISKSSTPTSQRNIRLSVGLVAATDKSNSVAITPALVAGQVDRSVYPDYSPSQSRMDTFHATAKAILSASEGPVFTSHDKGLSPYISNKDDYILLAARPLLPDDFVTHRELFPPFVIGMAEQCTSLQEKIIAQDWGTNLEGLPKLVSSLTSANWIIYQALQMRPLE